MTFISNLKVKSRLEHIKILEYYEIMIITYWICLPGLMVICFEFEKDSP